MNTTPLILDCDNTLGVPGCDVDDGLALLYLLGSPEVTLLGITTSYGNNTQDVTYRNTRRLLQAWGREDIPVFRGSDSPGQLSSPAADFLAAQAKRHSGKLRLLVTGSTTNLAGAMDQNPDFLGQLHSLSFMGGITAPLLVGGHPMKELNLSIDAHSSLQVLRGGHHISIATAQNCLRSYFPESEWRGILQEKNSPLARYLEKHLAYWFDLNRKDWDLDGIVNWDVMAAAQLLHPEYFDPNPCPITPDEDSMGSGCLLGDGPPIPAQLPVILDTAAYRRHIYETYFKANIYIKDKENQP